MSSPAMPSPALAPHAGPALSPVVVGCMRLPSWGLDAPALRDWMKAALDLDAATFDHADIYGDYGAESRFGEAQALEPGLRDRLVLIGKCGIRLKSASRPDVRVKHYDSSAAHILASVEGSLRALRTDRLDLLLLHRPDYLLRPEEVAEAFHALKRDGKVLHFGVSNHSASQVAFLARALDLPLVANQVEISLERPGALFDGTLDACMAARMVPMAWSPLGGGGLFRDDPAQARLRDALWRVGERHGGAAPDQVALAWLTAHPAGIRPVVGTGRLDRLAGAAAAARLRLDRQDWYELLEASRGHEVA